MFEPLMEDVFTRDDERVRDTIATLEGDVLDVGCGEGPYEDVLAARAAAGAIRYVGLDPDAVRIEALRARRPWGTLRAGTAEAIDDVARFDHLLVLRSWNHLRDPERALAALIRAARPGATITIADNVAFGLARTPAQAQRAERSPRATFEHYRNDDAAEAERLARAAGLTILERRDVGPTTSNQWMLRVRCP
jgi:SAM-dependent methyltransferase